MILSPKRALRSTDADQRGGFTLLEVILALAIFVGAVAVLSRLLVIGVENAEMAEWQSQAWLIAESRWAELESGIRTLSETGPFAVEEAPGWQWAFQTESTAVDSLYRVTVVVEKIGDTPAMTHSIQLTRFYFDDTALREEAMAQ